MTDPSDFWRALRGETIEPAAWPAVIRRAEREDVLFFLAHNNPQCPARKSLIRQSAAAHMISLALLCKIIPALNKCGRSWALLKGIALAESLYRSPFERKFSDIDILIRPEHLEEFAAAFREFGLKQDPYHEEIFINLEYRKARIDLHTAFVNAERIPARQRVFSSPPNWPDELVSINAGDLHFHTLSPKHTAVFLALHSLHHHGLWGAKWIIDIALLTERHPETVNDIADSCPLGRTVLALTSLYTVGPAAIQTDFLRFSKVERLALRAAYEGHHIPAMRFLLSAKEITNVSDRISFLKQCLFPSHTAISSVYQKGSIMGVLRHASDVLSSAGQIARIMIRS